MARARTVRCRRSALPARGISARGARGTRGLCRPYTPALILDSRFFRVLSSTIPVAAAPRPVLNLRVRTSGSLGWSDRNKNVIIRDSKLPGVAKVGQVLIRNLNDGVIEALKARASARGLSLEAELRDLLTRAAGHPRADLAKELAGVRARTPKGVRRPAEDLIREGRDQR